MTSVRINLSYFLLSSHRSIAVTSAISISPNPYSLESFTTADPSYTPTNAVHLLNFDTSKAERILGITKYITLDECTRDMVQDFHGKGW